MYTHTQTHTHVEKKRERRWQGRGQVILCINHWIKWKDNKSLVEKWQIGYAISVSFKIQLVMLFDIILVP